MKDYIDKLSLGVCEFEQPILRTSVDSLEFSMNSETTYAGSFIITSENMLPLKGVIYSTHENFRIINNTFIGTEITIKYEIDATYIIKGEEIKGNINIVCNGGESTIPYNIAIDSVSADTTIGKVKNLFHFANLLQMSYDEALNLFKSRRFAHIFLKDDFYLESVYEGLMGSADMDLAMEEFIIAANKKSPVKISIAEKEKKYEELTENYGDTIIITKSNWGYADIRVEVDGDFITGYKKRVTTNDFAGSNYEFPFLIDIKRLHQGKNVGNITFISGTNKITLSIIVKAKTTLTRDVLDYQHYFAKLYRMYLDFRLKKIEQSKWSDMSMAIIERMRGIFDDSYFVKLYQAQISIFRGRESESAWLLENVAESLIEKRNENVEMYCYYLYVRTLQKRDQDFTYEITKKIKEYYESGHDNWILLWILTYLDDSYDNNQSLKLARIKDQYNNGMWSPLMYYEAMMVLNEQPELLRILNEFEIQILIFGSKEGIVSEKLANQLADTSLSVKNFDPLLLRLLTTIYDKTPNRNVLNAIVSLLIKGNKIGNAYFYWYEEAVKNELKLTGLYEYYMYSIPDDFDESIPQIVLMYFSYNTSISSDKLALLYKNVISLKTSNPSMYDNYSKQINYYVAESIEKGFVNENMVEVYEDTLKKAMITPDIAVKLPAVINTYLLTCENPNMKQLVVFHKELKKEVIIPIVNQKAYITLYTHEPALIFIDTLGNRYCKSVEYSLKKLMDMEDYLKICYEITAEDMGLTLYYADRYVRLHQNPEKSIGILKFIINCNEFRDSYRIFLQNEIIEFYSSNYDGDVVDEFLNTIEEVQLSNDTLHKLIELMIVRGIYDKAYEYMKKYGYSFLEPRRVLKCVNKILLERNFPPERLLIDISMYAYRKGKYNENLLRYLGTYLYSSTEEMYQVWLSCLDYEYHDRDMSEKLLAQMLFTKTYINKADKVFKEYCILGANPKIKKAYLFFKAYESFVHEAAVDDSEFDFIYNELSLDNPIPELCKLALIKHYSSDDKLSEEAIELSKNVIESMCSKGKMFGFFNEFARYFKLPSILKDKTFVEYHTSTDAKVYIHYKIETGTLEDKEYQVSEMVSAYSGVFVKDFILFYGEKIIYYLTEEVHGKTNVTESKSLSKEDEGLTSDNSRYGMLNDMMVCADMKEESTLKDLTMQYIAIDELNNSIFSIM